MTRATEGLAEHWTWVEAREQTVRVHEALRACMITDLLHEGGMWRASRAGESPLKCPSKSAGTRDRKARNPENRLPIRSRKD